MADDPNFIQGTAFPVETSIETPEEKQKKEEYHQRLTEKLKDPEFRKIEGFPLGTDEAILALSDPPYYTACPNPFLPEILEEWQQERRQTRKDLDLPDEETMPEGFRGYHREPFTADVSEGKNDPIYNAHSYHTKVPHKAIMRYILHYTDPGDIVFDGFCGTGMTGVAAQLCGDKKVVESLGYRVDKKGVIYDGDKAISRLGVRKAVLNDLSPAATFIAYNYNTPGDTRSFEREAKRILAEVEKECDWMYETWHILPSPEGGGAGGEGVKGRINYTVWSDVFRCPHCGKEMNFWDVAVDAKEGNIKDNWDCPGCSTRLSKSPRKDSGALRVERVLDTLFDRALGQTIQQARQVPVLINYLVGKTRFEKIPDTVDLSLIKKIEESAIPYPFPVERMPEGGESRRNDDIGLTHVHHFYTRRNLWVLAATKGRILSSSNVNSKLRLDGIFQSILTLVSKLSRYNMGHRGNGSVSGTLYIASISVETNITKIFNRKISDFSYNQKSFSRYATTIQSVSSTSGSKVNIEVDYIFTDPPFGGNLMYSELNFLWEAWHSVITNNKTEAVINKEQKKAMNEYQELIEGCFEQFHQLLKPGRWMTVEFHNSQNSVWNSIQEALLRAGFILADVSTLDKQQTTFKQVTTSTAVKQDLVISIYKPTREFEHKFAIEGGSVSGAWEFIRQHLEQLPMPTLQGQIIEVQGERMPFLLYDRMVAFHLVRGLTIPLSSSEFYQGLSRFLQREGMIFTSAQVTLYDQMRLKADKVQQLPLFINDEASAIQWLRAELINQSQNYAEIQPKFMPQSHHERYEKLPELQVILEQNFLQDAEKRWYAPDPDKAADLEALRERDLLREFNEYLAGTGRIKVFRAESVKAGFSKAWAEHAYATIIKVAERLPEQALQEDTKLKLYYDNALNRAPVEIRQERLI